MIGPNLYARDSRYEPEPLDLANAELVIKSKPSVPAVIATGSSQLRSLSTYYLQIRTSREIDINTAAPYSFYNNPEQAFYFGVSSSCIIALEIHIRGEMYHFMLVVETQLLNLHFSQHEESGMRKYFAESIEHDDLETWKYQATHPELYTGDRQPAIFMGQRRSRYRICVDEKTAKRPDPRFYEQYFENSLGKPISQSVQEPVQGSVQKSVQKRIQKSPQKCSSAFIRRKVKRLVKGEDKKSVLASRVI
ncbi:unnamed protein product [Clonostachys rosea]|uniref:Uncharacterized protein n=1 Tax=Bionectria ochroleuca TaxID=29856 RepID=A0ABY6UA22_BIOOC|nr:unnamed protein product [Clonostachys rosea]